MDIQSGRMNETSDLKVQGSAFRSSPALLHEMMRSFTALARTLNLTQAVGELGSTRQTVRRHINQLEEAMQVKLFDVQDRRYALTDAGARAIAPAQILLDQGEAWFRGQYDSVGGMVRFSYENTRGWKLHQQELPISVVWTCRSELLRAAVKAWSLSEGRLESPELALIRPYILAYRDIPDGWICTEVGEESFYSNCFGWAQARSSVGRNLSQFQGGEQFASLADKPFKDISATHGIRLDQMLIETRPEEDGPKNCVLFDRLLMGVRMPDDSPAIISVVDRACKVRILGLDETVMERIPDRARADFAP